MEPEQELRFQMFRHVALLSQTEPGLVFFDLMEAMINGKMLRRKRLREKLAIYLFVPLLRMSMAIWR